MINNLKILSLLSYLEGISYLVLLAICMPLKYYFGMAEATSVIGMAHGLLFIAYCGWVLIVAAENKWSNTLTVRALFASILPFGTFVADKKIFRQFA